VKTALFGFRKYLPLAVLSIAALAGEVVCDLLQPSLLAQMIDEGVLAGNSGLVRGLALRMLAVTFVGMSLAIARAVLSSHASQRFGRDLRLRLYEKIQGLSLAQADEFDRASLVTRVTNDAQQVQGFVNGMMRIFLRAPVLAVGGVVMATLRTGRLALALVVVMPIAAVIVIIGTAVGYPNFYRVQLALDRLNGVVREYLSGVRVVKAFNSFALEKGRFEESNESLTEASRSAAVVLAYFSPLVALVINLGIAAVIWLGGRFGEEPGKLVALINYMTQILFAMAMFSNIFNQLVRSLVSSRRIEAVLKAEDARQAIKAAGEPDPPAASGELRFEDVTFTYPGAGAPALTGITFAARQGETIGVIGSTGSGKSTLVNLIPRFYEIDSGRITLNGEDIRSISEDRLRERIALVPQTSLLFTGTISGNVRWGKENATDADVWAALEAAQADGFVRDLTGGLDATIGRGGVNLSGGQKQRISIARALIRLKRDNLCRVLLLDDSASALDANTEAALRLALRQYTGGTVTLMISQRVRSVRQCDRIIVLDDGKLAGEGTHDELMRECAVYRDIFESQFG